MIELISIFFFIFLLFFLLSFNNKNIFFNYVALNKNNDCEFLTINFLILLNIIWLSSIFNFDKNLVFCVILIILFLNFLKNLTIKLNNKFKINLDIIFLFITSLLFAILIAHDLFFSHDVRLYWFEKTLLFYNDLFITQDRTIKPEYPHYGTYLWAFFWKYNFLNLEYFGRIIYFILYLFSISYILNKVKFSKNYLKYLIFFFIILLTFKIKWFDGRQDILIFSFNTLIFGYLYELISNRSKNDIHIFGLILSMNLLIWSKNDSLLYFLTYLVLILFYVKNIEKYKLIFSLVFIIFIKIYFYQIYEVSLNPNLDTFEINFINHLNNLDLISRFYEVIFWYFIGIIRNPILLLSLIFMIFLYKNVYVLSNFSYFIYAYLIISVGVAVVYLVTKYDFPFHMIGSVGRVFLQFSMVFLIPILKFCEKKKLV